MCIVICIISLKINDTEPYNCGLILCPFLTGWLASCCSDLIRQVQLMMIISQWILEADPDGISDGRWSLGWAVTAYNLLYINDMSFLNKQF